jgi:hypothetical protein
MLQIALGVAGHFLIMRIVIEFRAPLAAKAASPQGLSGAGFKPDPY